MSGLGFKTWVAGDVLSAADVNGYLMKQAVLRFADSAARSSAIPSPTSGMLSYLASTGELEVYGTAWANIAPDALPAQAGNAGEYLSTDGTVAVWAPVDALPSQTGNAGAYLTTNGTAASWATITTDPNPQIFLLMGA